jgi:hypothetical protein
VKHLKNSAVMSFLGAISGLAVGHGEEPLAALMCLMLGVIVMLIIYIACALLAYVFALKHGGPSNKHDFWDRSHRMFRVDRPFLRDGKPW